MTFEIENYNRNNTRRVHINMIIDPREGNGNAKVRRARALLFPIPRVNNHVDMENEDFIPFITWKLLLKFGIIFIYLFIYLKFILFHLQPVGWIA